MHSELCLLSTAEGVVRNFAGPLYCPFAKIGDHCILPLENFEISKSRPPHLWRPFQIALKMTKVPPAHSFLHSMRAACRPAGGIANLLVLSRREPTDFFDANKIVSPIPKICLWSDDP